MKFTVPVSSAHSMHILVLYRIYTDLITGRGHSLAYCTCDHSLVHRPGSGYETNATITEYDSAGNIFKIHLQYIYIKHHKNLMLTQRIQNQD